MMNNDEQIEEYEISFYTFIYEEENNKEPKKNDVKGKFCDTFLILYCGETINVFLHIIFIVQTPPIYWMKRMLKNHRRVGSIISCKNEG